MYNSILIINLMYIGDLLFTTPLIRALRANFPSAHIAMLADKKNADVIKYNPHLSELIAIDKKGYHNKLKNYIGLISDIRKRQFDLVINLHANERASAIAAFSGAREVIGFAARPFGIFFDRVVKERHDVHQADAYLEILREPGIAQVDNHGLEIWVDEGTEARADKLWQEAFADNSVDTRKVIGLNTGGSWPTKRWTKEGFAALADRLLETGYGVAFFGGPMDREDVDQILSLMNKPDHPKLAVFTGKTTLLETAALIKKCAAFISGDSGPMHIAVAQKVPVVAIFGPSDPVRYHPYDQQNAVVTAGLLCQPCGEHACSRRHECMERVTVDMVWERIMKRV